MVVEERGCVDGMVEMLVLNVVGEVEAVRN